MTTTKKTTTTTTTTTSKGKMKKKDLSEDPKESEAASKGGLHWPVVQVAVMDVVANALVTVGFFYVGSGVCSHIAHEPEHTHMARLSCGFFSMLLTKETLSRTTVAFFFFKIDVPSDLQLHCHLVRDSDTHFLGSQAQQHSMAGDCGCDPWVGY
jgi:hypothetical protein